MYLSYLRCVYLEKVCDNYEMGVGFVKMILNKIFIL